MSDPRSSDLAAGLAATRVRIEAACREACRDPAEITLVVVTKTWPADDVRRLVALGVRDMGENRDQEAAPKAAECSDLDLRWHFIGQLQRNKAASVARYADVVHSVNRPALITALARGAERAERSLDCLIQVNLDPEPDQQRGGVPPAQVAALADAVAGQAPLLRLRGLMGVAPLGEDPAPAFARLAEQLRMLQAGHPEASWLSAGMSGDLEQAIAAGATHLRIGSAVLGSRPPLG